MCHTQEIAFERAEDEWRAVDAWSEDICITSLASCKLCPNVRTHVCRHEPDTDTWYTMLCTFVATWMLQSCEIVPRPTHISPHSTPPRVHFLVDTHMADLDMCTDTQGCARAGPHPQMGVDADADTDTDLDSQHGQVRVIFMHRYREQFTFRCIEKYT